MNSLPLLPLMLHDVPEGLNLALAQEGVPALAHAPGASAGKFVLHDSRRRRDPLLGQGQQAIDVHELRDGFRRDPFEALLDEGAVRKRWNLGPLEVAEELARVDKRAVRGRLMRRLRQRLEAAGGAWLKLAAHPFPYRSTFNLRLDHDEWHAGDFDAVLGAIQGHEEATSHYVCGATHEDQPAALARLRDFDVGSHGYRHHTYHFAKDNLANVRRGIDVLEQAGLDPSGYAAPHGRFNRGLLSGLEELGVTHSSEFALAYDELPFFPSGSSVLQIPVHPLCLGIALEALMASPLRHELTTASVVDAVAASLVQCLEENYHAGEPVFLYGHPDGRLGRYPQVLQEVLAASARCGALWRTSRTNIAAWWRARSKARLRVFAEGDCYRIAVDHLPPTHRLGIEYWRGDHMALLPLDNASVRFSPFALAYEGRRPPRRDRELRIDRATGLRGRLRRYLDWEKVTPLDEINAGSLRGWMKKTLRRVKS